ncbi:hypothetical protein RHMOL_Rhmol08G0238200 [Rhododendron molle]|uniref:Uncharacterized protein n=1 Tax=Rhododendron molle TaxID=49168 RepID=A0ACC0MRJ8_RHOML|nr:hypothetical protein RHMOL_Rhmol08G0238200 [Rhododendron molle]
MLRECQRCLRKKGCLMLQQANVESGLFISNLSLNYALFFADCKKLGVDVGC